MVKVRELILELGKLLEDPEVRLKSIKDLEVACQNKPEFISTIIEVLVNHLFDVKPVDSDAVETVFMAIFRQNKMATFAAVLKNHPTRLFPESDKDEYVYPSVQLRLYKIKSVKRRIADLIEKSLENVSKEELQQLAKLVEAEAALDANDCKFDVWDTVSVDRFLSCLQMAVPLFARGAPSMLVDCVLKLPDFDKLSDERKFDFLRALAEISSHTTAPVAQQLLPLVAELSKTYISQTERGDSKSFAYVECVLYLLLHLSHKAPDVATQTCSKEFMWRFKSLKSRTWERMKILAKTLSQDDIDVLDAEKKVGRHIIVMETKFRAEAKRQSTKTEIRSCINILAIRKLLKKRKFCFVKLSWKEARNASKPSKTYRNKIYQRAPYRSAELESISKDCSSELAQYGKCDLSYKQVQRLVGSKKFQEFSSDRKGPFVLNDTCGTAMLSWHMEESALSFLKECGEEGRSGKVRNQMYHLTCAMYVGSDLVSSERHLRKLEKKEQGEKKKQGEMRKQGENTKGEKKKQCQPLCPWNLCIFCDPSKLGKDKRAKEDKRNRLHHCYGAEIENVLSHIQANGASREIVSDFLCTDYLPPTADDPSMKRRKNIKLRRLHSLKEVVKELKKHTVGADLINYSGLMRGDKEVYEACMDPESVFVSYHAVVIEKIQKMGDDWVAVCKMSNGRYLGRDGYCNVSLTTKYIPIGVSDVQGDLIRGSEKPMHLLTNFIIVEIIEDEEENWNSDDEEDAKDDKKPSEENPKEKQKEPEKKRKEPEEKRKDREEKKYTPKKFRSSGNTPSDQLTQVTESDAVDVIEDAITRHNSNSTTELTALVARFPSISERIKDIIVKQKGSLLLEMQQRAIEYNSIVDRHKNIRSSLVERMPVLDEATFNVRRAGSFPASASTGAKASVSLPNGFEKPAVAPLVDLLDLDSDDILAAPSSSGADYLQDLLGVDLGSSSSQFGATQAPKAGTDLLLDILSIGTPSPAQNSISSIDLLSIADANSNPSNALDTLSSPVPPHTATTASTRMFDLLDGLSPSPSKEATNGPAYPSIVAYESSSLKIEFTFSKPPGNPQTTNVQATFINLSPNTFTDFIFQAAVPKFLQLHLDPASSNTLPASGNGAITQNLKVTNSQHGKKSLVMRMRIGYKLNEKDVLEEGQVSNFPRGL
ncbi:PREDICTED: uncharacterized protein LOC104756754 isoform X3 [Camelina sativa]|uniref:Uncharacterized protein LOC104756754 isoform X3 n=1 Tax=Camelina sativa TaxID=90675 RepID=A0ABM0WXT7_CAMSA|nr:PREDICTED: uncharacterized protein LOC104756754 isoform X3 [Camelina sativa]